MQQVLWIIDGNNLIHRTATLAALQRESGFPAACAFLESELSRFRARQGWGHSVVVAYDGISGEAQRVAGKGLRIVRPQREGDADRLVLDEARRAEGRMEVHVVSSDRRDITGRLRGLRVQIHESAEFATQLWPRGDPGSDATPEDPDKPPPPKGGDVNKWLREFGFDEDEGASS